MQSLLYEKSSPDLPLVNQTYTKMLNCLFTLFPRLYPVIVFSITSNSPISLCQNQIDLHWKEIASTYQ